MNKIVLIYPKIKGDFHWFPWSLLGMAQILKDNGYDVVIWDERVQGEDELLKALDGALFACISIMIGEQITNALNIAKKITVPIVWGGPFVTLGRKYVDVDTAVVGCGESVILQIAKDMPHPKKVYYGKPSLSKWKFGLIDINKYINPSTKAMAYFSSYGCTNHCSFCGMGGNWRCVPEEQVIGDIDYLTNNYGFKTVIFYDANFCVDEKRVWTISRKTNVKWRANARADQLLKYSDETLDEMARNCSMLFIGVETVSKKLMPLVNKGETAEQMEAFIRRMSKYPITLGLSLMFGLPHETPKETQETIDFYYRMKDINKNITPTIHFFNPLPGTRLFNEVLKLGYAPPKTLEEWGTRNWSITDNSSWLNDKDEIETLVRGLERERVAWEKIYV